MATMTREWTYRTPEITVTYMPGDHEITDKLILAAARKAGALKARNKTNEAPANPAKSRTDSTQG